MEVLPADMRPASASDMAQKRQAGTDSRGGQQLPSWKRQCRRSPSATSMQGESVAAATSHQQSAPAAQRDASGDARGAAEAAAVPAGFDTEWRLLPGFQRNTDAAPAAYSEALARVNAHCIDAPVHQVLIAR